MRGPVTDTRVEAIMPGVRDVTSQRRTFNPEGQNLWVVFVGRYDYEPGNTNDASIAIHAQGQTGTWIRFPSPVVTLNGAVQVPAPRGLYAFLRQVPSTSAWVMIGGPTGQEWHGPLAAALLYQEPTPYQAARLVQALARML